MLPRIRATVLAGIWLGALVGGVGGRLAMMLLRALTPNHVHGLISDDGFFIGRVTIAGTYNLIAVSAFVGVIGSCAYRWVDRWLLGPGWFRNLTCALGAGVVVGSMLVKPGGVDFTLLRPQWLAIALFVAIPAVFGFCIGPLQRLLARPAMWKRRRWGALAIASLLALPPLIVVGLLVSVATLAWTGATGGIDDDALYDRTVVILAFRAAWLAVAVIGLVSLVGDARTILA